MLWWEILISVETASSFRAEILCMYVKVIQLCLIPCDPMDSSKQEYWSRLPFPSLGDLPNPGIEPKSPALQVDPLLTEPQGMPKNARAGSLSLLQGIFLTQELNWGLPHCRQILYQLNFQRSYLSGSYLRLVATFLPYVRKLWRSC